MKQTILDKMKERGYEFSFESRNNADETVSMNFWYNAPDEQNTRIPIPPYNVTVWIENMNFQFTYIPKNSINKLISPVCSSFMNDEHFDKIMFKFEREAAILHKYCV